MFRCPRCLKPLVAGAIICACIASLEPQHSEMPALAPQMIQSPDIAHGDDEPAETLKQQASLDDAQVQVPPAAPVPMGWLTPLSEPIRHPRYSAAAMMASAPSMPLPIVAAAPVPMGWLTSLSEPVRRQRYSRSAAMVSGPSMPLPIGSSDRKPT